MSYMEDICRATIPIKGPTQANHKGIPNFLESLECMKAIHVAKNRDYAPSDNPYQNFDVQAYILALFKHPIDQAFAALIAVKLARLANLLSSDAEPNNESIDDTFIDMANYTLLWKGKRNDLRTDGRK